jgi:hypothetical protein
MGKKIEAAGTPSRTNHRREAGKAAASAKIWRTSDKSTNTAAWA